MTRRAGNGLALLGYTTVAFVYFGLRIAAHPGRYLIGYGRDPQIFVWSFAWWPHAIGAGQNPFVSHAIYAPDGVNLAWVTSVPGLALLFSPVTVLFGPDVSYNLAAMLMPAVSAWTAYLLCRHITGKLWPSLAGGYLFGFSSYMIGQEQGHLHMTAVFLVPLIALALLRHLQGELDGRGLAWRLGVLFGAQFWLSTEILFTAAFVLVGALALGYGLIASTRSPIRAAVRPLLGGAAIAAAIAGPLLVYTVTGFRSESINVPAIFDGDLLNFVVPTHLIAIGGSRLHTISERFAGNEAERDSYLGLPTLLIAAWYAARARPAATARFLIAALGLTAFITLGTELLVKGKHVAWLPWTEVARLPLFNNVLPSRLALYVSLIAAVIVALWTASHRGLLAWALPALAIAALVPAFWLAEFRNHPERWAFFSSGIYKVCIPKGENVAIFPFGASDDSTLWQAESDFWFRMPEGYLAPRPPAASYADPLVRQLTDTFVDPTPDEIVGFVHRKKVDRIVSVTIYVHPNGKEMHRFGEVQGIGGVLVAPACGYPSMQQGIHPSPLRRG